MNTIETFLQQLLSDQNLTPEQERTLEAHKTEVTDFLRKEFGNSPIIKYAGSLAKGTMIQDCFDLDIVCYFPSSDTRTLKEIRDDVSTHLGTKYVMQDKASAERIINLKGNTTPSSYHIDVVPGRFIENTKDVFLHIASGDRERMQTNLKTHIDYIANSNCVPIIRLAKTWVSRNNITIKTFVLELFVVRVLSGSHAKSDLKKSFLTVLESFRDEFEKMQLVDPANSGNIVSQLIPGSEKTMVALAAKSALQTVSDSDDVNNWKTIFNEKKQAASSVAGTRIIPVIAPSKPFTPQSPWCI